MPFWGAPDPEDDAPDPEHGKAQDGQDEGSAGTTRGQHPDDAQHDHHEDDEDGIT